jgi:hypothetical protein
MDVRPHRSAARLDLDGVRLDDHGVQAATVTPLKFSEQPQPESVAPPKHAHDAELHVAGKSTHSAVCVVPASSMGCA